MPQQLAVSAQMERLTLAPQNNDPNDTWLLQVLRAHCLAVIDHLNAISKPSSVKLSGPCKCSLPKSNNPSTGSNNPSTGSKVASMRAMVWEAHGKDDHYLKLSDVFDQAADALQDAEGALSALAGTGNLHEEATQLVTDVLCTTLRLLFMLTLSLSQREQGTTKLDDQLLRQNCPCVYSTTQLVFTLAFWLSKWCMNCPASEIQAKQVTSQLQSTGQALLELQIGKYATLELEASLHTIAACAIGTYASWALDASTNQIRQLQQDLERWSPNLEPKLKRMQQLCDGMKNNKAANEQIILLHMYGHLYRVCTHVVCLRHKLYGDVNSAPKSVITRLMDQFWFHQVVLDCFDTTSRTLADKNDLCKEDTDEGNVARAWFEIAHSSSSLSLNESQAVYTLLMHVYKQAGTDKLPTRYQPYLHRLCGAIGMRLGFMCKLALSSHRKGRQGRTSDLDYVYSDLIHWLPLKSVENLKNALHIAEKAYAGMVNRELLRELQGAATGTLATLACKDVTYDLVTLMTFAWTLGLALFRLPFGAMSTNGEDVDQMCKQFQSIASQLWQSGVGNAVERVVRQMALFDQPGSVQQQALEQAHVSGEVPLLYAHERHDCAWKLVATMVMFLDLAALPLPKVSSEEVYKSLLLLSISLRKSVLVAVAASKKQHGTIAVAQIEVVRLTNINKFMESLLQKWCLCGGSAKRSTAAEGQDSKGGKSRANRKQKADKEQNSAGGAVSCDGQGDGDSQSKGLQGSQEYVAECTEQCCSASALLLWLTKSSLHCWLEHLDTKDFYRFRAECTNRESFLKEMENSLKVQGIKARAALCHNRHLGVSCCFNQDCTELAGMSDTNVPVKACKGCRQAWYCSTACIKADWKQHKPECKRWTATADDCDDQD